MGPDLRRVPDVRRHHRDPQGGGAHCLSHVTVGDDTIFLSIVLSCVVLCCLALCDVSLLGWTLVWIIFSVISGIRFLMLLTLKTEVERDEGFVLFVVIMEEEEREGDEG